MMSSMRQTEHSKELDWADLTELHRAWFSTKLGSMGSTGQGVQTVELNQMGLAALAMSCESPILLRPDRTYLRTGPPGTLYLR
jgi:hypothetical protein